MICERCKKKEATVFYEETINGESRSFSLCEDCAAELGKEGEISLLGGFGSFPTLGGLTDELFGGLFGIPEKARSEKTCPVCHSTLRDFGKSGKTGCPECYRVFADELRGTIASIHGNVRHVGRAPAKFRKRHETEDRLAKLRADLEGAIKAENFELAAKLRDEIRAIGENK